MIPSLFQVDSNLSVLFFSFSPWSAYVLCTPTYHA